MRTNPCHSPQMAVTSIQPQPLEGKRSLTSLKWKTRHSDAFILKCSNLNIPVSWENEKCRSVNKNVSRRWAVPVTLPQTLQETSSPVIPDPTHSKAHGESFDGPQTAITSPHSRLRKGSRHHVLEVLKLRHSNTVCEKRSKTNVITVMKAKPSSLTTPVAQISYSPCYRLQTCSRTHCECSCSLKMAASPTLT